MSRQVGSLHRSIYHPTNLQNPIPIIPFFAFPPPESPILTHHPAWIQTHHPAWIKIRHHIFSHNLPIRQFRFRNPWRIANSEPSPSTFSQPPFRSIRSQSKTDSPSTLSHISRATPTYSPFTNERSNNNSPDTIRTKQPNNTAKTSTTPLHPKHSSIIDNHNVIKPTNSHIFFRLYLFFSPILNINPIIIPY